jgi:hypothetical protein
MIQIVFLLRFPQSLTVKSVRRTAEMYVAQMMTAAVADIVKPDWRKYRTGRKAIARRAAS